MGRSAPGTIDGEERITQHSARAYELIPAVAQAAVKSTPTLPEAMVVPREVVAASSTTNAVASYVPAGLVDCGH